MAKPQPLGVQHGPLRVTLPPSPVRGVAGHWMTQSRQVHPDLVGAPRLQIALDECMTATALDRLDPGPGWAATLDHRHAQAIARVPADGPLNHLLDCQFTPHDREGPALECAVGQLGGQLPMRQVGAGCQDQA